MSTPFRSGAFAHWVPEFVAASHRCSGIARLPSVAEIAAYRGLFALERIAVENVLMFLHHAVGPEAAPRATVLGWKEQLLQLNDRDLDIDDWCERFLSQRLLRDGNARCARALRTWYRLRAGEAHPAPEWAEAAFAASPRPVVSPYSRAH